MTPAHLLAMMASCCRETSLVMFRKTIFAATKLTDRLVSCLLTEIRLDRYCPESKLSAMRLHLGCIPPVTPVTPVTSVPCVVKAKPRSRTQCAALLP